MYKKEITMEKCIENAKAVNVCIGRSLRGIGTEILDESTEEYRFYKKITASEDKTFINSLREWAKNHKVDDYYVSKYCGTKNKNRIEFDDKYYKEQLSVSQILKEEEESGIYNKIVIQRKPKLIGYLPIGKYDYSFESQKQFVTDVLQLKMVSTGRKLVDETYYNYYDIEGEVFEPGENDRCMKVVHNKGAYTVESKVEHFDGRMSEINEVVIDNFWTFFDSLEMFEFDEDYNIVVYHRKGKDWYIGPKATDMLVGIEYCYYDKESDRLFYSSEDVIFFYYEDKPELIDEAIKTLETEKLGLEAKSMVCNIVGIFNQYSDDYYVGLNNYFDREDIDKGSEAEEIMWNIEWPIITESNLRFKVEEAVETYLKKDVSKEEIEALKNTFKVRKDLEFFYDPNAEGSCKYGVKRGKAKTMFRLFDLYNAKSLDAFIEEKDKEIKQELETNIREKLK
jgi:hypothetical protein